MMRKITLLVLVVFVGFSACASGKEDEPEKGIPENLPSSTVPAEPQDNRSPEAVSPDALQKDSPSPPQVELSDSEIDTPTDSANAPEDVLIGIPAPKDSDASQPLGGIYVGILEFGGTVKDITPEFVFFDSTGKQQLLDYIDSYYSLPDSGSAFYYAVHKALTNIDNAKKTIKLPQDASTTIIAITDGLEIGSTNPDLDLLYPRLPDLSSSPGGYNRNNFAQYQLYIEQLLDEQNVNMTLIPEKKSPLANKNLNQSVAEIVSSMNSSASNQLITFTVHSAVYPHGTRLRIVLDGQTAANSGKFIEGEISVNGSSYKLTDVTAQGIRLNGQPSEIPGVKLAMEVHYTIEVKDTFNKVQARQWYMQPSSAGRNAKDWVADNEGAIIIANSVLNDVSREKSAVVYLILDGSPALEKNVEQIRREAKSVINRLDAEVSKAITPRLAPMENRAPTPTPVRPEVTRNPPNPAPRTSDSLPTVQLLYDKPFIAEYNGRWWIQVGAFQKPENIRKVTSDLQNKNYRVDTSLTTMRNGILLRRVLVGPYKSKSDAEAELQRIGGTF